MEKSQIGRVSEKSATIKVDPFAQSKWWRPPTYKYFDLKSTTMQHKPPANKQKMYQVTKSEPSINLWLVDNFLLRSRENYLLGIFWPAPHCPQCSITKKIIWWSGGDGEEDVCPNIIIMAEGGGGTYKTQMADNRIISLLHPLPAPPIPKISFFNFSHDI